MYHHDAKKSGQYLRHDGDDLHRPITDSTALKEGQAVTCYEGEDKVYRWEEGKLRWYPSSEIANSYNIRWRPEMAHVDCQHLEFGEDMPLKTEHREAQDGDIVTCFGHEEKVYIMEDGKLRWFPTPTVAYSYTRYWRPEIIVDCEIYPFGPDMPLNEN